MDQAFFFQFESGRNPVKFLDIKFSFLYSLPYVVFIIFRTPSSVGIIFVKRSERTWMEIVIWKEINIGHLEKKTSNIISGC